MSHLRVSLILLVLGTVAGLTVACGQQVAGEPKAANQAVQNRTSTKSTSSSSRLTKSTRPSTTSSRAKPGDKLSALEGTWEGEYTCNQGTTGLKLTISQAKADKLPATFAFFPLPENRAAKTGSYSMLGSVNASGQLIFKQEQWIDQPDGYVMVDLAVTSPIDKATDQLSGDVLEPSCKGFSVRRR